MKLCLQTGSPWRVGFWTFRPKKQPGCLKRQQSELEHLRQEPEILEDWDRHGRTLAGLPPLDPTASALWPWPSLPHFLVCQTPSDICIAVPERLPQIPARSPRDFNKSPCGVEFWKNRMTVFCKDVAGDSAVILRLLFVRCEIKPQSNYVGVSGDWNFSAWSKKCRCQWTPKNPRILKSARG